MPKPLHASAMHEVSSLFNKNFGDGDKGAAAPVNPPLVLHAVHSQFHTVVVSSRYTAEMEPGQDN